MELINKDKVLKFSVKMKLKTALMLRSGNTGEFADSEIEMTPDKTRLHINGYVWASLIRRAMGRLDTGKDLAATIGDYDASNNTPENTAEHGVSPVWFESSFTHVLHSEIRPWIKIDRQYGSTSKGALFSDEILSPGHSVSMNFNWFCSSQKKSEDGKEECEDIKKNILSAIAVIDDSVETIGGGWSYGFGRLAVLSVKHILLDLKKEEDRKKLFSFNPDADWVKDSDWKKLPESVLNQSSKSEADYSNKTTGVSSKADYSKIIVNARVAEGQLLAIGSNFLPLYSNTKFVDPPDSFLYRSNKIKHNKKTNNDEIKSVITIPGKAIRQALFSVPVERKLRSTRQRSIDERLFEHHIKDSMDKWFGSTEQRGSISIADSTIKKQGRQTVVLNRIQLCEHSMQNNNLFAGEYLKSGHFTFEIILSPVNDELKDSIIEILEDLKVEQQSKASPPGWYRIGATSTCTGQIEVLSYEIK